MKGEKFVLSYREGVQVRIDSDAVKEYFKDDLETLAKLTKDIPTKTIGTTRYEGKKPKFEMPNLANATPQGLTDMLGALRERMKDDKKLEGIFKEALKARLTKEDWETLGVDNPPMNEEEGNEESSGDDE